ncbi:MAG: capsule assembly Wzi family protein [Candidatus Acidiferrales bacterium]
MKRGWKGMMLAASLWTMAIAPGAPCRAQEADQQSAAPAPASPASAPNPPAASPVNPVLDPVTATVPPEASASPQASSARDRDNSLGVHFVGHLVEDQEAIWTSPLRIRWMDMDWLVPLGVATGGMLATDTEVSKHISTSPSGIRFRNNLANYGLASFGAAGAGLYFWGVIRHDDRKRETGLLAGEAALDSLAATYALKYTFGRERPLHDDFQGRFFQGGDSFPSMHASLSWSIAGIIAHEYPGPLTTFLSYGMASAISASRVDAKQHFPTDVMIGGTLGWLVARQVYRSRHDPELGGGEWNTYAELRESGALGSGPAGSPYVELDSWVYPAMDRLAALGYVHSAFLAMRPWTRIECAHLAEEASDAMLDRDRVPEVDRRLILALQNEFRPDLDASGVSGERTARVESLYSGVTDISGAPLNDSRHFGQTIINNFGRPYQQGLNSYDGGSAYATLGRFTLYVRGEYQHAPSAPAYSENIEQAIAAMDVVPVQPPTPIAETNRFHLLDTYVAARVANWDFAFGKQSLWWSPAQGGALIFSDNADPIYMFRASRIEPFQLPWIFRYLGPMKTDFFFGKISGAEFPPRPLIHGEKISFHPTANLDFGFSRTSEFGGVGRPLTPAAVFHSYFSFVSSVNYAASGNPGKRTGGFDFSYKLPYLRKWLSIYADSLSDDDPSPLAAPRRAAIRPGFYLAQFPRLRQLDFRVEAVYTDTPTSRSNGGLYVYWDQFYRDLYTSNKNLIGDWIGREGMGFQASTTYRFGSRNTLELGYRRAKVAKDFVPGGETVNDGSAALNLWLRRDVNASVSVQAEKWLAPILAPGPQMNWTTAVGITYTPHSGVGRGAQTASGAN